MAVHQSIFFLLLLSLLSLPLPARAQLPAPSTPSSEFDNCYAVIGESQYVIDCFGIGSDGATFVGRNEGDPQSPLFAGATA